MDNSQVDNLLAVYGGRFPVEAMDCVRKELRYMDYHTASLYLAPTKDPIIALILSLLLGGCGVDRLYIGCITTGILKLVTCGGFGIWYLVDLFLIMDATKQKNLDRILGNVLP